MIRAVIFDVDGVLLDSLEANFLFFEKLFHEAGFTPPTKEEYRNLFHRPMRDVIKAVTGLVDEDEIQKIWERGCNGEFATPDAELPNGAEEVVRELSKDYLLGITTSRVKTHIFEGSLQKLRPYFRVVVSYEDTENHKPHPEPLLLVAERLEVLPGECVYVGDVENDALAARAAGMKIIIYSKDAVPNIDVQTADFREVSGLVKNLSNTY